MYGWERFPPKAFSKLRHNWWDERNHNEQWRKFAKNQVAFNKYLAFLWFPDNIILKFIIPYYYSRYKERSTRKIGAMVQCSKIFSRYFNFRIILYCAPLGVSRSANVLPSSGHKYKYKYVALNFCIISRPPHLVYK